jgi:F0F1-type ATP synthase assembly protein I
VSSGAPGPDKPGRAWRRVSNREAGAGYDLAANIFVGLGLGWGAQKLWPGITPWGYAAGIILGTASGFYQLFKTQNGPPSQKKPE